MNKQTDGENLRSKEKWDPAARDGAELQIRFARQAERLRGGIPIAKVIGVYTKLSGTRKGLRGDCPLHGIATRTLKVNPQTNTFRCSFCGVEGDVIAFLEKVAGLTYGQALEALEHIYYADDERDAA